MIDFSNFQSRSSQAHSLRQSKGFKGFQEFVFISNGADEIAKGSKKQLRLTPDTSFLSSTNAGSSLLITKICAAKNVVCQLHNLHFKPGKRVQLVNKTENGSVVVSLDNKLIGMGSEIADKIIVTLAG